LVRAGDMTLSHQSLARPHTRSRSRNFILSTTNQPKKIEVTHITQWI
jgi:hypothetical protein